MHVPTSLLRGRTVLCGAGISRDALSFLPQGDQLALRLFDLVCDTGPHLFDPRTLRKIRDKLSDSSAGLWQSIRLELLFELFAREMDARVLVRVYSELRTGQPHLNHFALLLARPGAVFTTNQDVLLERAARDLGSSRHIQHLHGRCDRPHSIITLISQYLRGLSAARSKQLRDAVNGHKVVVLGYSGRDRDIMPILASAQPAELLWILHRSDPSVSPELAELKRRLGSRLKLRRADTTRWIMAQLDSPRRVRARGQVQPAIRRSASSRSIEDLRDVFSRFSEIDRCLAIGRVAEHVGLMSDAADVYTTMLRRRHLADPRVRLALADAESDLGEFRSARRRYQRLSSSTLLTPKLRSAAMLGEVNLLRNTSHFDRAEMTIRRLLVDLDQLPASRERDNARAWAIEHLAGNFRMSGDEDQSLELYNDAERLFRRANSIDGLITVAYYRSDLYRSRGRYADALSDLERALTDGALFARASTQPWPHYYYGHTLCSMGDVSHGFDELEQALQLFVRGPSRNRNGEAWALLMLANFSREKSLRRTRSLLARAGTAIRRYGARMAYGEARLWWERAELARAERKVGQARRYLKSYFACIQQLPGKPRYMQIHGSAIEAELARDQGDERAAVMLSRVRSEYESLHASACAARIAVSEWLVSGGQPPRSLVDQCRRRSFDLEYRRLLGQDKRAYFPLHVL